MTAQPDNARELTVRVASTLDEVEEIRGDWRRLHSAEPRPSFNSDVDRYVSVAKSLAGHERPLVIVVRRGKEPLALVAARIGDMPFRVAVGYKTLFAPGLRCLSAIHGGYLGSREDDVVAAIWRVLGSYLEGGEADAVFFNHLPVDSPLVKLAERSAGLLGRGRFAFVEPHWSMTTPRSMDEFYSALAKPTRKSLRRTLKTLYKEYPDSVEHVTFPGDVGLDAALAAVEEISAGTYQRGMGAGYTGTAAENEQLAAAARQGRLRIHLLRLDGAFVAYEMAMEYAGTYYLYASAYDARLAKLSPGKALFLMLLERLAERGGVERVDFGFGDAEYKRIYCDTRVEEKTSFVFARRARPIAINLLQGAAGAVSAVLKKALAATGGARRLKTGWRRRIASGEREGD